MTPLTPLICLDRMDSMLWKKTNRQQARFPLSFFYNSMMCNDECFIPLKPVTVTMFLFNEGSKGLLRHMKSETERKRDFSLTDLYDTSAESRHVRKLLQCLSVRVVILRKLSLHHLHVKRRTTITNPVRSLPKH